MLIIALLVAPAAAADLVVGPGQSYADLTSAVAAASDGDRILLLPGTYTDSLVLDQLDVTLEAADEGVSWQPSSSPALQVTNAAVSLVNLDVTGGTLRFAEVSNGATLTVVGGAIHGFDHAAGPGAAFHVDGANLVIDGTLIHGNTAASAAAVHCTNAAVCEVRWARIHDNEVPGAGGAIGTSAAASLTVEASALCRNRSTGARAGAIDSAGSLVVTQSLFLGNEGTVTAGAMAHTDATRDVTVGWNAFLSNNNTSSGFLDVGALRLSPLGTSTVRDNLFAFQSGGGGALYVSNAPHESPAYYDNTPANYVGPAANNILLVATLDIPEPDVPSARCALGEALPGPGSDLLAGSYFGNDIGLTGGPLALLADEDEDGWPAPHDCDDTDPARHPYRIDVCNGADDDCDGDQDELAGLQVCPVIDTAPTGDTAVQDTSPTGDTAVPGPTADTAVPGPTADTAVAAPTGHTGLTETGTPTTDTGTPPTTDTGTPPTTDPTTTPTDGTTTPTDPPASDDEKGGCGCTASPVDQVPLRPWARRR